MYTELLYQHCKLILFALRHALETAKHFSFCQENQSKLLFFKFLYTFKMEVKIYPYINFDNIDIEQNHDISR